MLGGDYKGDGWVAEVCSDSKNEVYLRMENFHALITAVYLSRRLYFFLVLISHNTPPWLFKC